MVDAAHPITDRGSVTITQSRTSWGIEFGQHRLAVTRTREARTVGEPSTTDSPPLAVFRSIWPLAIGTFASVSAFGLVVFGAVASEPLSFSAHQRYAVSVPLPSRATKPAGGRPARLTKARAATSAPASPLMQDAALLDSRLNATDESYIARAMRTGEFQEWLGADGQRRFLSAGAEQADGDRRCRELAMLIRRTDGSNQVRNSRHCIGGRAPERAVTDSEAGDAAARVPIPGSDLASAEQVAIQQGNLTAGR